MPIVSEDTVRIFLYGVGKLQFKLYSFFYPQSMSPQHLFFLLPLLIVISLPGG